MEHRKDRLYGIMAEFETVPELLDAIHKSRDAGYCKLDAYTPFPVHEVWHALGYRRNILPWMILCGGIIGCIAGFMLQYWVSTTAYPINIGGRPLNSWPSFIPVTFECTILLACLTAVFGMFAINGLPQPHHPVFNVERFALASRDRLFLCLEADDPKFDRVDTASFLWSCKPSHVAEVADS